MHSPDFGRIVHVHPQLALSSCLLGQEVCYDGLHKRHDWLANTLGRFVDFMRLCSDVSIGLSISLDPVHLNR